MEVTPLMFHGAVPGLNGAAISNGNGAVPSRASVRAISPREAWRLAGLLFIGGTLSSIPTSLLVLDTEALWRYSAIPLGLLCGLICLTLPWQRVDDRWLNVISLLAIAEIMWATLMVDFLFSYLFFFVAVWIAVVFPRLRELLPHLLLLAAAPFIYLLSGDVSSREALRSALSISPALLLTSIVVARLTAGLEASRASYEALSDMDGLTGVGNYRALMARLHEEIARHRRRQREFAVLTLDLDDFKAVNETQGHLVGDLLLALVGAMLDLEVRTEDMVFRQGGDEFSVIAPETAREQGLELVVRIEEALAGISAGRTRLSATVSLAIFPQDGQSPAELIDAADASLYARRRVERSPMAVGQRRFQPGLAAQQRPPA